MGKQQKRERQSLKGVGDYWDEVKHRYNISLTPTAVASLDAIASKLDISRSELIERMARALAILDLDKESCVMEVLRSANGEDRAKVA